MGENAVDKLSALYKVGFLSLGGFTTFLLAMKGTAIYSTAGAILVVSLVCCYYKTHDKLCLPGKNILVAWSFFAGGLIMSSLLQGELVNIMESFHYVYLMANFFVMYLGVRCFGKREALYKAITIAAIVNAAFCAISYFNPHAWSGGRFTPITNPNVAVQFMVLPIPFMVASLYMLRKYKAWLGLNLISMIIILVAAGFTRSRGGITGFIAGALTIGAMYWPLLKSKWSDKRKLFVCIISVGLASALVVSITVHAFSRGHSDQERVYLLQSSVQMFLDQPLTGVGYENFTKVFPSYKQPKASNPKLPTAHNDLFNLLATTGIFGAGGYVVFSLILWFYLLKRVIRQPREAMLWAMIWMFVSVYIHGLVDISIQYNNSAKMFFGMLGMTLAIADEHRYEEE